MRILSALCLLASVLSALAGEVRITALNVEADTAKAVTGQQAQLIAQAAAHTNRTDNPHGVTAPQIGAATAAQGALAETALQTETDAIALAALATNRTSVVWMTNGHFKTSDGAVEREYEIIDVPQTYRLYHTDETVPTPPWQSGIEVNYGSGNAPSAGWEVVVTQNGNSAVLYGETDLLALWIPFEGTGYDFPQVLVPGMNDTYGFFTITNYPAYVTTNLVATYYLTTNPPSAQITLDDVGVYGDARYASASVTNAPVWLTFSGVTGSATLTNIAERPMLVQGSGAAALTFAGLRPPLPLYIVASGFASLSFPGAYVIGSGSIQTNMNNHLIVWRHGTNTLVNLVTATEE